MKPQAGIPVLWLVYYLRENSLAAQGDCYILCIFVAFYNSIFIAWQIFSPFSVK